MRWWPLVGAVLVFTAATGAQQVVITNNSETTRKNTEVVQDLLRTQARIDERTKAMKESQDNVTKALNDILRELRK